MQHHSFIKDETGAVTVDWVVLTAAVVGLGIATAGVVQRGMGTASGTLVAGVINAIPTGVTALLTNPQVFGAGSQINVPNNLQKFAFSTSLELDANKEGILFELGGVGSGTILYQHDGKLYLQAGKGDNFGQANNRGEVSWDMSSYTGPVPAQIEGQVNADGGLELYVNGVSVGKDDFTHGDLAGNNYSIVGDASGPSNSIKAAVNRGAFGEGNGHPDVGDVKFFFDQTTGAELD